MNGPVKATQSGGKYPYAVRGTGKKVKRAKAVTKEQAGSVLWKPKTREEWDDCVSEMTTLAAQVRGERERERERGLHSTVKAKPPHI